MKVTKLLGFICATLPLLFFQNCGSDTGIKFNDLTSDSQLVTIENFEPEVSDWPEPVGNGSLPPPEVSDWPEPVGNGPLPPPVLSDWPESADPSLGGHIADNWPTRPDEDLDNQLYQCVIANNGATLALTSKRSPGTASVICTTRVGCDILAKHLGSKGEVRKKCDNTTDTVGMTTDQVLQFISQ